MKAVLQAALQLPPVDSLRPKTYFTLFGLLYAELPWKAKFTPELRAKAEEIREKLTELVDVLVPKDSEKVRFEIAAYRRAVRFARGTGLPQLTRTVRIFTSISETWTPKIARSSVRSRND